MAPNTTKHLDEKGRQPGLKLEVFPLGDGKSFTLPRFNSYSFNSNILIPVDTFSFTVKTSSQRESEVAESIQEGDTVQLTCGDKPLSTGYIDAIEYDTDVDAGTRVTVNGRDLMGVLEDNDAVTAEAKIIWPGNVSIDAALTRLIKDTRLEGKGYDLRNVAAGVTSLFGTNPGESRLAALQRYLEPFNAIAWVDPIGKLVVGKPSFYLSDVATLGVRAMGSSRGSNVLSMNVKRASGQIPNAFLVIWTGNERAQGVFKESIVLNPAEGPTRLWQKNHKMFRCITVSAPDSTEVKNLAEVQRLVMQGSNFLRSYAAREIARENIAELVVTCTVSGHLNANGDPYQVDQCYRLVHDVAKLDKRMYLYGVEYQLTEEHGQISILHFCNVNTIVAAGSVTNTTDANSGRTRLA